MDPKNKGPPMNPVAVPRPGDPGHSLGLRANFFAIPCVNFYEFFI